MKYLLLLIALTGCAEVKRQDCNKSCDPWTVSDRKLDQGECWCDLMVRQ